MIDEILDAVGDFFSYIFSFEWIGDIGEFFSTMFEGISEISVLGIVFGLIGLVTIYIAKDYMLSPFLKHMGPIESILWGGATYFGTFIAGYLVGSHFQNT